MGLKREGRCSVATGAATSSMRSLGLHIHRGQKSSPLGGTARYFCGLHVPYSVGVADLPACVELEPAFTVWALGAICHRIGEGDWIRGVRPSAFLFATKVTLDIRPRCLNSHMDTSITFPMRPVARGTVFLPHRRNWAGPIAKRVIHTVKASTTYQPIGFSSRCFPPRESDTRSPLEASWVYLRRFLSSAACSSE